MLDCCVIHVRVCVFVRTKPHNTTVALRELHWNRPKTQRVQLVGWKLSTSAHTSRRRWLSRACARSHVISAIPIRLTLARPFSLSIFPVYSAVSKRFSTNSTDFLHISRPIDWFPLDFELDWFPLNFSSFTFDRLRFCEIWFEILAFGSRLFWGENRPFSSEVVFRIFDWSVWGFPVVSNCVFRRKKLVTYEHCDRLLHVHRPHFWRVQ